MSRYRPLQVAAEGDEIVIRVGAGTLARAVEIPTGARVTDEGAFVRSMVSALGEEAEDGTTLVHRLFDEAAEWAVDQGMDGFECVDDEDGDEP